MVYYPASENCDRIQSINKLGFKMFKLFNRFLFGGIYKVVHICSTTGKRKVFWCCTWQDALEWASCALNEDTVVITDNTGFLLASR